MLKSTIQITSFSVFGIGITFAIQVLLTFYFGAGEERDAYFAALTIPSYIIILFTGSLGVMLIPALVSHNRAKNLADEIHFSATVFNWCFIVLLVIISAGLVFSVKIINLMIPDFKSDFREIAVKLFRIQLCAAFFVIISTLSGTILQAKHMFIVPALIPIVTNSVTLIFVITLSKYYGISGVAYGNLAGSFLSFVIVAFYTLKLYDFHWKASLFHPGLSSIFGASVPLFAAGIFFRSSTVIERFLAARLPEGGISYLGSANQIVVMLSSIITAGLATSSFPVLSKYWQEQNSDLLKQNFKRLIVLILMIVIPLIVVFIVNGVSIIRIVFEHGVFSSNDTLALYRTMVGLMGFFLFTCLGSIVSKILYLSQNTWAVSLIAGFEIIIYFVLAMILIKRYEYLGLAMGLSLSAGVNIIVSLMFIKKRIIFFKWSPVNRQFILLLFWTILIAVICHFINVEVLNFLPSLLKVMISTVLILVSFLYLFSIVFKVQDLNNALLTFKKTLYH